MRDGVEASSIESDRADDREGNVNTDTVLVVGLMIVGYTLISGKLKGSPITPAIVFVVVGLLAGPDVLDIVEIRVDERGFQAAAELALALLLMLQASRIDYRTASKDLPKRLVGIGLPVAIAVGTLGALLLFPELSFWEAAILAILVAPPEAALVEALVSDRRVPERVRRGFTIESGMSDGLALGLLLVALALASEHNEGNVGEWLSFVGKSLGMSLVVGGLVGLAGGWLLARARRAGWVTEIWSQLYLIALAPLSFVVVEHLDGSGFVGAFGAGLAFAAVVPNAIEREEGTAEAACELLELVVFALFALVWPAFDGVEIEVLVYALLSLAAFRMLGVLIASARLGFSRATRLYMGWFGPRGLASLILGLLVIEEGVLNNIPLLRDVVVVTVTLSILLHGLTGQWGTNRYAEIIDGLRRRKPDAPEVVDEAPPSEPATVPASAPAS
jgi:sodium/hydrogen antiporter